MYLDEKALRLKVGTGWVRLTAIGEIGVIFTRRGFIAALEVKRGEVSHILFVSASSLSSPLNEIIQNRGKLDGLEFEIKKAGEDQFSPYEVKVI
jgi:hypothetical protein